MVLIRPEQPADIDAVREVNRSAFGRPVEAEIVDRLRQNCPDLISLVAVAGERILGHITFSPVTIEGRARRVKGLGLGPLAVLPGYQSQGIGSTLVRHGLNNLRDGIWPFVVVLGHSDYYPRFGFEAAGNHGIYSQWEVPEEAFMILVLNEEAMQGVSGVARYRPEFEG